MARRVAWEPRGVVGVQAVRAHVPVDRFLPEPPLDAWVERFWSLSWDLRGQPPGQGETLPHPSVYLVIEAGNSGVAGVTTGRFLRRLEGRGRVYGAKFHPGCFRPFWSRPARSLTDLVMPLESVFGPDGRSLEAGVLSCGEDVPGAVARLEAFLLERLPCPDPRAQLARALVARILSDRALTQSESVAREAGLSLRALQRLFQEYVGVSPKWIIQRYRLHDAMALLEGDRQVDLPALAHDLGFFDQSHFIRVFKAFLGRTPSEYVRQARG